MIISSTHFSRIFQISMFFYRNILFTWYFFYWKIKFFFLFQILIFFSVPLFWSNFSKVQIKLGEDIHIICIINIIGSNEIRKILVCVLLLLLKTVTQKEWALCRIIYIKIMRSKKMIYSNCTSFILWLLFI